MLRLKKSPGGTAVSSSSTSDNEDSTTVVGASEKSSVNRPIGPLIPEFFQPPEEGSKRPSSVRRQDTGDVLPQNNSRIRETNQSEEVKSQYATMIRESGSQSLDGEGLAGRPPDEQIDSRDSVEGRDVSEVGDAWISLREERRAERVDFGSESALPSKSMPGNAGSFDPGA